MTSDERELLVQVAARTAALCRAMQLMPGEIAELIERIQRIERENAVSPYHARGQNVTNGGE